MAAPIGNEYWKLRSKDGRDKEFDTPEDLFKACNEYFEWCQENPLKEQQIIKYKDSYEKIDIDKMRPFTLHGLCNFIDISIEGFKLYEKRKDFIGVTTRARQLIYNQKFEGAASGFLNPNIIARDLGLIDKKELEIDTKMTKEERQKRIAELKAKL